MGAGCSRGLEGSSPSWFIGHRGGEGPLYWGDLADAALAQQLDFATPAMRQTDTRSEAMTCEVVVLSERFNQNPVRRNRKIQIRDHSTDSWLTLLKNVHVTKGKRKKRQERLSCPTEIE